MKEVGSPAAGKTRTLNSALPPIGHRYRALAILKSHIAGQPHRTRQSRFLPAISLRTSAQRRSRSASDGVGYSTSLRMFLGPGGGVAIEAIVAWMERSAIRDGLAARRDRPAWSAA